MVKKSNGSYDAFASFQNPEFQFVAYIVYLQKDLLIHCVFIKEPPNKEIDQRVRSLLKMLPALRHIKDNKHPFQLSMGQKRQLKRSSINRNRQKKSYLLDEPTFGQDSEKYLCIIGMVRREYRRRGTQP